MSKRIINLAVALALIASGAQAWNVASAHDESETAAKTTAASAPKKRKGNGFVNALTAPFRAVGKLFGGGNKGNKLERLSEKDVAEFQSAPGELVHDARTPSAAAQPEPAATQTALDLLAQGRKLLDGDSMSAAIAALSRATYINPELSEAHGLLGVAYDRKGLTRLAVEAYKHALRLSPGDVQTLNNYGYSLFRSGDYRGAAEQLKRAAKLAPSDRRVWNNLALAQCQLGKYNDAYKSFARVGSEFSARLNMATVLERAGRNEEALKHYEAARRVQPASPLVLQRLAELYQRTGQSDAAAEARLALSALKSGEPVAVASGGN